MSSTKAEYVALSESSKTIIWFRSILQELGIEQQATKCFEDNLDAIKWATQKSDKEFSKQRHVDTRYHFVKQLVDNKTVLLVKESGSYTTGRFLNKAAVTNGIPKCPACD